MHTAVANFGSDQTKCGSEASDQTLAEPSCKPIQTLAPASSFTEWGLLKAVVLGSINTDSFLDADDLSWRGQEAAVMRDEGGEYTDKHPGGLLDQRIVEEAMEDLEKIQCQFEDVGIVVHRPNPPKPTRFSTMEGWSATPYFPYCPRDVLITMGKTVVEAPSPYRSRYLESQAYLHILEGLLDAGTPTVGPPKPRLADTLYRESYCSEEGTFLSEEEPVFDAANVLRCGKDVLYQVSHSGNSRGAKWLQVNFPDRDIHIVRNLYSGAHLDTTLVMLRPGLFLAHPGRVKDKSQLPEFLQSWEMIYPPEPTEVVNSDRMPLMASKWLGINLLSLSENLAMVCSAQEGLIRLLEQHGIEVIPTTLRHGQALGGGIKCCTWDLTRDDELTRY